MTSPSQIFDLTHNVTQSQRYIFTCLFFFIERNRFITRQVRRKLLLGKILIFYLNHLKNKLSLKSSFQTVYQKSNSLERCKEVLKEDFHSNDSIQNELTHIIVVIMTPNQFDEENNDY